LFRSFQLPKSVVNNAAVSDHHAIIPTEEPADWGSFGSNERKIYDLVIQRFLAVLSEPYIYEETRIQAKCSNEYFTAKKIIGAFRSKEHTSELQSRFDLVCRLLLEKKQT